MSAMLQLFPPLRVHREVHGGKVHCPVRLQDMDVERCGSCAFLADLTSDETGVVGEIVCKPTMNALFHEG